MALVVHAALVALDKAVSVLLARHLGAGDVGPRGQANSVSGASAVLNQAV